MGRSILKFILLKRVYKIYEVITLKKNVILSVITLLTLLLFILKSSFASNDKIKIGILQLVEHDALDEARQGFIDGLAELGLKDEENIVIDYENAQADQSNCYLLANKLVNKNSDLVLAIATPAAQAMANSSRSIPTLVTAITSPEAAGVVESNEKSNTNVTGTSDLAPVKKQIDLIKKLKPSVQKIGIMFCSNEANSVYQASLAEKEINELGLESEIFTVSQSSEISSVVQSMVCSVDAIYTPTDNMMASTMPTISSIATSAGVPIVCGETNVVNKGAAGTFGMDYYKLGKLTAHQAFEILVNGKKIENMQVEYLQENQLTLNADVIEKLNLSVPEELRKMAEFTHTI